MKNVSIVYGSIKSDIEKKALELLSQTILDFTAVYPLCVKCGEEESLCDYTKIYIGTKENNPYIRKHSKKTLTKSEEFFISVKNEVVIIEGYDERGVLWGCSDFYNKYLVSCEYTHNKNIYWENPFDKPLPEFEYTSCPAVSNRGIWTWGHVIYDYRKFIDNMVKLKLNTVIIWNDNVPLNAKEMVDYAHSAGIKIIWGYSWFWDVDCNEIDIAAVNDGIPSIIEKYEREYLPLGGDGIYFQSFTELYKEEIGGVLIAEAVSDFVNNTSRAFYEKYPDIELQFGLHATSVKEKLSYIRNIDPKIRIVWEDCGAFPFHYLPKEIEDFDETMLFMDKIMTLRGENDSFAAVTKGIVNLSWIDFNHIEGPVYIGAGSKRFKKERERQKRNIWKYIQSYWMINADKAQAAVKKMAERKNGDLYITALVEDGMFEETIMFPPALYSEILWNPNEDIKETINSISLRNYVEFA